MVRIGFVLLAAATLPCMSCSILGPRSLATGRGAYNRIINQTEDEQFLSMIVRQRYDETFGMLAVSSVTSSISASAAASSDIGIGPQELYEGSIVPLSLGVAYEERPTISYVPVTGEVFLQRALEPISLRDLYLLGRASYRCPSLMVFMIHRVNGFSNAVPGHRPAAPEFLRAAEAYLQLNQLGVAEVVHNHDLDQYALAIVDYAGHEELVSTFLEVLGVDSNEVDEQVILLPMQPGIDRLPGTLTVETRSVVDIIRSAGEYIDIPKEHLDAGIVVKPRDTLGGETGFLRVRSSRDAPENASVATLHRGYWFYIDGTDSESKRAFMMLRTLVGIRLANADLRSRSPTLTIPVY